jgi:hypothetical protein
VQEAYNTYSLKNERDLTTVSKSGMRSLSLFRRYNLPHLLINGIDGYNVPSKYIRGIFQTLYVLSYIISPRAMTKELSWHCKGYLLFLEVGPYVPFRHCYLHTQYIPRLFRHGVEKWWFGSAKWFWPSIFASSERQSKA